MQQVQLVKQMISNCSCHTRHIGSIFQCLQKRSDCVWHLTQREKKKINNGTSCWQLNLHILQRHSSKRLSRVLLKLYRGFPSFHFIFLQTNKRTVNIHSNKSARVLVRSATGRLVLSLVMANSCMPSSSATLACVRLFTSELRSSYGEAHRTSLLCIHVINVLKVWLYSHTNTIHRCTLTWKHTQRSTKTSK